MIDLFTPPTERSYRQVYAALSDLRESFHRSGRLDDSNAKLDEVSKLFATYLAFRQQQIGAFLSLAPMTWLNVCRTRSRPLPNCLNTDWGPVNRCSALNRRSYFDQTIGGLRKTWWRSSDSASTLLSMLKRWANRSTFLTRLSAISSVTTSGVTSKTRNS